MYKPLQMVLICQWPSKEQVMLNQLIASKCEVWFRKVVKTDKKKIMSITVIRACLLYEYKLGTNTTQAACKLCTAFAEVTVSERTAQKWFRKFVSGDETLEDAPHEGWLNIIDDNELKATNQTDSCKTRQELAERFNVSSETICLHLHCIGKVYKLNKWIPHKLTADNKLQRLAIYLSLLSYHNNEPFLDQLFMCDEKWLLYINTKRSSHWLSSSKHVPHTEARNSPTKGSAVYLLEYSWYRPLCAPTPWPINHREVYSAQLHRVHDVLLQKQPALVNSEGTVFLQDNARPHTMHVTQDKLQSLAWEILTHPPYSSDISPSDYHLF
jgi:histone-lysine N-methyltransferase SETMAR